MLRQQITFEIVVVDQDRVVSSLVDYQQATQFNALSELLDFVHSEVRDGRVDGTAYLFEVDSGNAMWTEDVDLAEQYDEPFVVRWSWVETTAHAVEVIMP